MEKLYGRNPDIPIGEEDPMLPRYTDKCRCSICGKYFNSSGAFGRHRVGPFAPIGKPETRRCLSVEEMLAKDFFKKPSGHWARGKRPANAVAQRRRAAIS